MKKIAIIPARGGSKRIPRKNIRDFFGRPIISYSIDAALRTCIFDEVMVSTDDYEIAEIAKQYGASVPFYRSEEMSSDIAGTVPTLLEVIKEYDKQGIAFEQVCCLYPCAPFVTSERLSEAMNLLNNSDIDCVLPVVKFSYPPQRCLLIRGNKICMQYPEYLHSRSQDLEPLYHDAGQFYCIKTNVLLAQERLFCENTIPIILSESEVQDIDTEEDWIMAEVKYRILTNK